MSLTNNLHIIDETDSRGYPIVYLGSSRCFIGDHIGTYDDNADETTGYPVVLINGDVLIDDQDRDELRSMLIGLGLDVETDEEGLVLVQI